MRSMNDRWIWELHIRSMTHTHTLANAFILGKGTSRIRAPLWGGSDSITFQNLKDHNYGTVQSIKIYSALKTISQYMYTDAVYFSTATRHSCLSTTYIWQLMVYLKIQIVMLNPNPIPWQNNAELRYITTAPQMSKQILCKTTAQDRMTFECAESLCMGWPVVN